MVLFTGMTSCGVDGVSLAVALPVKTCASAVDETEWKGRLNVTAEAVATVFTTCQAD